MVRHGFGLFAGYDLENSASLRRLNEGLQYWYDSGRDEQHQALKDLKWLELDTVKNVDYRMRHSPLLTEILTSFLNTNPQDYQALLLAGQLLTNYATPMALEPRAHAYQDALLSWQHKWPIHPRRNIHLKADYLAKQTTKEVAEEAARRKLARGIVEDDQNATDSEDEKPAKKRRSSIKTNMPPPPRPHQPSRPYPFAL